MPRARQVEVKKMRLFPSILLVLVPLTTGLAKPTIGAGDSVRVRFYHPGASVPDTSLGVLETINADNVIWRIAMEGARYTASTAWVTGLDVYRP